MMINLIKMKKNCKELFLKKIVDCDLVIVSDYGHGLISGKHGKINH